MVGGDGREKGEGEKEGHLTGGVVLLRSTHIAASKPTTPNGAGRERDAGLKSYESWRLVVATARKRHGHISTAALYAIPALAGVRLG